MSSSVLSLSASSETEDGPLFGRCNLPEEDEVFRKKSIVLGKLHEVRENVRHNGTSLEHGAPHGAIAQITVSHGQTLSFIDNHGRLLLVVGYDGSPQALQQAVAAIEAATVPVYLIERAKLAARHDWPITFSRQCAAISWSLC